MSDPVAIVAGAGGPLGRAAAVKLAAARFTVVRIDGGVDVIDIGLDGPA
jgi:NAD(P)-dependent dehydrogenase (short-subunit alcohol dehydrogenase family)